MAIGGGGERKDEWKYTSNIDLIAASDMIAARVEAIDLPVRNLLSSVITGVLGTATMKHRSGLRIV